MRTFIYLSLGLICIVALVQGRTTRLPVTVIREVTDGESSLICELFHGGEVFRIANKTFYTPLSGEQCVKCANCSDVEPVCIKMFRPCPKKDELKEDEELLLTTPDTAERSERTTGKSTDTSNQEITQESADRSNKESTEGSTDKSIKETTEDQADDNTDNTEESTFKPDTEAKANTDNNTGESTLRPDTDSKANTDKNTEESTLRPDTEAKANTDRNTGESTLRPDTESKASTDKNTGESTLKPDTVSTSDSKPFSEPTADV